MKCQICGRGAAGELCFDHAEAKKNLKSAYPLWVKAYGGLGWRDFLDNVKRNPQSGQWVKEAAEFLEGV